MVPPIDGMSYSAFVAPGLLASSCLNGAITDGFFNIFFKLHFQKTYDGILATPMRVPDVVFGEMLWALGRGSLYAAAFLVVLLVLGEASGRPMLLSRWALLAWPAAVLAAATFSAMAICLTTFARKVQDFDMVMGLLVMPMFLFSGIFVPVTRFPEPVQWILRATPLYHGVGLLRQLTTGSVNAGIIVPRVHRARISSIGRDRRVLRGDVQAGADADQRLIALRECQGKSMLIFRRDRRGSIDGACAHVAGAVCHRLDGRRSRGVGDAADRQPDCVSDVR